MNDTEILTRRTFELYYPLRGLEIISQSYIGDLETIFELSDGRRILFDETRNSLMTLLPHEDGSDIADEEWEKEFKRRLRKKIALSPYTQKELCEIVDISENSMSNYVNGRRIPDITTLRGLARALKCTLRDLTDFDYLL